MQRLETKVLKLTRRHGVAQKSVTGAYDTRPLRQIEFLFHEVGHWVTLGHAIDKLPRKLSNRINEAFRNIAPRTANNLEIDASFVTYLAGYLLGLWQDCGPIAKSCVRNLNGIQAFEPSQYVVEAFELRWKVTAERRIYVQQATAVAKWLCPSAKLTILTDAFPERIAP